MKLKDFKLFNTLYKIIKSKMMVCGPTNGRSHSHTHNFLSNSLDFSLKSSAFSPVGLEKIFIKFPTGLLASWAFLGPGLLHGHARRWTVGSTIRKTIKTTFNYFKKKTNKTKRL